MDIEEMIRIATRRNNCKYTHLRCATRSCSECENYYEKADWYALIDRIPELLRELKVLKELKKNKWIPVVTRPLTEEEKQEWEEYEYECVYECELPEDGQEVLITTKYGHVALTTFYNDYGAYFEDYEDYDDVLAWMPLPEAYKGAKNETN